MGKDIIGVLERNTKDRFDIMKLNAGVDREKRYTSDEFINKLLDKYYESNT